MFTQLKFFRAIVQSCLVWLFFPLLLFAQNNVKFPAQFLASKQDLRFTHLTTSDGLSQDRITCILRDSRGLLWIGTEDGLNRYDGYSVKVYRHNPRDTSSLSNNDISDLCEDRRGRIWVGTRTDIQYYDPLEDAFRQMVRSEKGGVNTMLEDLQGNFWVATSWGLYCYGKNGELLKKYSVNLLDSASLSAEPTHLMLDKRGALWIGTKNGLCKFNESTNQFSRYFTIPAASDTSKIAAIFEDHAQSIWISQTTIGIYRIDSSRQHVDLYSNRLSLGGTFVISIGEDEEGNLWFGTFDSGLVVHDSRSSSFTRYESNPRDPRSLRNDRVTTIYKDSNNNMWVGAGAVERVEKSRKQFHTIRMTPDHADCLDCNKVGSVLEDRIGNIWVGTAEGLRHYDQQTTRWTTYRHNPKDSRSISSNIVSALREDRDGRIWIGCQSRQSPNQDLQRFDSSVGGFTHFPIWHAIRSIFEDRAGELWVGIVDEDDSRKVDLLRLDKKRNIVRQYDIATNGIWTIYQDRAGTMWTGGMYYGFSKFDSTMDTFTKVPVDPADTNKLSSSAVRSIYEDSDGCLWLATWGGGLNRYDPKTGVAHTFRDIDGLPSNFVKGILPDEHSNLWISTEHGLTRFDPRTTTFKNFTLEDGLPSLFFLSGSCWKGKGGWMYFGSDSGLVVFHPDSIRDNPHIPSVWLSSFKVLGKDIALPQAPFVLDMIELAHDQNFFSFDMVALDYTFPAKNQYAHKLEGLDQDWVYDGTRRYVSYTHVPPGDYVLHIKGANSDGVWNEKGTFIKITITPPWWKTTWAYLSYGLCLFGLFYSARRYDLNRVRLKHQAELEHVEAEKLREVDHLKSQFFANISHEFRTPLTLILGPIQKWKVKLGERHPERSRRVTGEPGTGFDYAQPDGDEMHNDLTMMERNAQRLLRLINQLLDLSKLEAGGMKLQTSRQNIVPFVKGIAQSFESSAGRRGVALNIEAESEDIEVYFDRDKLEKILVNLLSNAFKFTPERGRITVTLTPVPSPNGRGVSEGRGEGYVEVKITDTGIGIPQDQLDKVFDRFYQVDASQTREQEGSGIGLALTKELVELHHGSISVTSEAGKGTTFTVALPLGREHLKDDEITEPSAPSLRATDLSAISLAEGSEANSHPNEIASSLENVPRNDTLPLVLIIEDNADVRAYIKDYLLPTYRFEEARDGAEGIAKAKDIIPDLIISDVMMPKIDGNEVCRTLKRDEKTSHIPIILLTAKAGQENKLEGLETGADDYLTKPFDAKELLVRMRNLIELRRKLRDKFSVGQVLKPGEITVTSVDNAFLQKVKAVVELRMGAEEFSVEELAHEVAMSRSQLHRKLIALTNLSAGDFVRYMRLHRARQLLEQNGGTVSEVAYQVGFSTAAHFSKCFREQFGVVPRDVRTPKQ